MTRYKVTTELKTPLWKKIFRWLRIIPKLSTFELRFHDAWVEPLTKNHILVSNGAKIKIIKKL
nr:MAG TPA: hypothetical protein [Caudoviricetes sp.]